MSSVLLEGTLYVDQSIDGVAQGLEKWRGIAKLGITANSELKEAISKDKDEYGQVIASAAINKPADLSVVIREITGRALAMSLQGSVSEMSQGSGSVASQDATAKIGKFIELGKRNIASAGFLVKDSTEVTTYTLNTDYRVNYAAGFVEILAGGAITEGQALKITYDHGAVDAAKVLGATVPQVKGKLVLDGRNLMTGRPTFITIWDATLTAEGEVDFMSDDPIELTMKGRMTTPAGKTAPFEIELDAQFA